ncbi:MAG TPA: hypothetical protein VF290_03380 [Pyrinomonadaceae bacterium]
MSLFFSNKAVRLLLSISVSVWMAGGCLFGCSNTGMAAEHAVDDSAQMVEAGESCHTVRPAPSHDCCASPQPKPQTTRRVNQPEGLTSFAPTPRGMMQDCPLVTNATAATSKNSPYGPDPGRVPVAVLPQLQKQTQFVDNTLVVPFLPNRGPTHLLCCVFLI